MIKQRQDALHKKIILQSSFSPTWFLVDQHKTGTRNQGIGLLEALNLPYTLFSLSVHPLLKALPRSCWPLPWIRVGETSLPLTPPWPNLLVAAGTVATLAAARIRKASRGRCFTIALQNPRIDLKQFDCVIAPRHDALQGDNILETFGALHRVTPERLVQEALEFRGAWDGLPHPLVTVLVGGPNRHLTFGREEAKQLGRDLKRLHEQTGCGFLMTCSRRTPLKVRQILETLSSEIPLFLWNGEGKTPYFAFLAMADYILVTEDSVSMLCEAAATDKPIFVYPLPGKASKFEVFHQHFFETGVSKPFKGELHFWARAPLLETQRVAEIVKQRLADVLPPCA
ncbi:MAG: mitochondrial fission ELM1 family protein [Alphaproteobacteria bacterium]